jgi:hypothetical protein
VFSWLRRLFAGTKKFDMFRSVWFSNMDCVVNNIRYLQDDSYEYQQPSEPCESNQPVKSEQCYLTKHVKYYDDAGYRASSRNEPWNDFFTGESDYKPVQHNDYRKVTSFNLNRAKVRSARGKSRNA